jgi:spore coat protein U-like protein
VKNWGRLVSQSKEPFELGFVVSAICVVHVVCVALLAGMTSSTAAQTPAAVSCKASSAPALDFGVQGAQAPNVNAASIVEIQCSSATPYTIGFDAEPATGTAVVVRKLSDRDATVNYLVYLDGDQANTANNTVGTEAGEETAEGGAQRQAIDGRRPAERASSDNRPGMVRVTVTY